MKKLEEIDKKITSGKTSKELEVEYFEGDEANAHLTRCNHQDL